MFANGSRLGVRSAPNVPVGIGAIWIQQRSEIGGISATQHTNCVWSSLEAQFSGDDSQTMPTLDKCRKLGGVAVPQLRQSPGARHCIGFALLDLAVKNASVGLQIRNHTSHEILRLPGRCPLLGPTKMASAKVLALGMQGERSFGGSGAPAHLYQTGYQPRVVSASRVSCGRPNYYPQKGLLLVSYSCSRYHHRYRSTWP